MEILKVENLTKSYGKGEAKVDAIKNINLSINKGEFVAIVGPSGSGKSTLLHLLGGVDKPTSGKVYINDVDIYTLKEKDLSIFRRRNVGLIYQFYNLIPVLSVKENILLPAELDNRKIDKDYLDDLLKTLGLKERANHLPNELSGGQRQRAFIGMVLAQDTDYIFLDEPLNNLDMKHSVQIMKMLRRITDELGKTVVIVIHDINFASCYSDEIIALQDGEIAVTGTVNEIMQASTLSKLYDMEFNVQEINDKKICVYY